MAKNGWDSVFEAAVYGAIGEDSGCCGVGLEMEKFDAEKCCKAKSARYFFERIADAGGPTLEQCEALARGDLILAKPVTCGEN